ncbi:MAG: hypothetical protein AAB229_09620 [Candidatus Hydrogenedentota bacterium]
MTRKWNSCLGAALVFVAGIAACGKTEAPAPAAEKPAAEAPAPATAPEQTAPAAEESTAGFKAPEEGPAFFVYKDLEDPSNHFIPAGHMGDVTAITVDPGSTTQPHSGTTCMKWTYDLAQKKDGWAGAYWQDPENNWNGDVDGAGYNLKNAKTLKFWARGENGGETLKFGFGGCNGKFGDTGKKEVPNIKLTKVWQEFEIPVADNMQRVVFGFMWAVDSKQNTGQKVIFYLDDIRYEF